MKILIACEFSGIVREAFRQKGHDAWSCDLLPTEIPGQHIQGDVLEILDDGWDMMIAYPPCTYLSVAGAVHYFGGKAKLKTNKLKRRYEMGQEAKDFFMELYNADIDKICIENPQPLLMFCLPAHTQVIQPSEYGHPFQRRTLLWLKNLPKLTPTNIVSDAQSTKIPGNWFNSGGKERQKNRSRTFPGIAEAMASQWGNE